MEYDDKARKIHAKLNNMYEYFWQYNNDSSNASYEKIVNPYINQATETWYDYDENGNVLHYKSKVKDLYYELSKESWYEYDNYGDVMCRKEHNEEAFPNAISIKYIKYDENRMPIHVREHITFTDFNNTLDAEFWIGYDENNNEIYYKYKQKSTNVFFDEEDCEVWRIVDKSGNVLKEFHNNKNK
jgi:hypothetical protein